jgi:hypothetical protein
MPLPDAIPTTLTDHLRQLGLTQTAADLNDLIARATQKRWSPVVVLETIVRAELDARAQQRVLARGPNRPLQSHGGFRVDLAQADPPPQCRTRLDALPRASTSLSGRTESAVSGRERADATTWLGDYSSSVAQWRSSRLSTFRQRFNHSVKATLDIGLSDPARRTPDMPLYTRRRRNVDRRGGILRSALWHQFDRAQEGGSRGLRAHAVIPLIAAHRRCNDSAFGWKKEGEMHAAVVTVDIAQSQFESSKKILTEQIVPRVRGSKGFVKGYWTTDTQHRRGTSVVVFDTEANAREALNQAQANGFPPGVTLVSADVHEVTAEA